MMIRGFEVNGVKHYAIIDLLEALGFKGPTKAKARGKLLKNVSAGDLVQLTHRPGQRGNNRIWVVTEQGLADIMEDYPELRDHMGHVSIVYGVGLN